MLHHLTKCRFSFDWFSFQQMPQDAFMFHVDNFGYTSEKKLW